MRLRMNCGAWVEAAVTFLPRPVAQGAEMRARDAPGTPRYWFGVQIAEDDLTSPEVTALLAGHLADMVASSPPGSVNALDLDGLRDPSITFLCAWDGSALLGFGALKQLDPRHGEIKSMRTVAAHLRKGVATAILDRIVQEATRRSYERLSLETGTGPAFGPAHAFYVRNGFRFCEPFGGYAVTTFNRFMTRWL